MNNDVNSKLTRLKDLVKQANGEITPDIIKLVEEITLSKQQDSSVKKAQEALELINRGFDPEQIISNFINTPQPPIVLNIANNTFSSVLSPVKMSFAREIPRYIDAISYDKTLTRKVPRLLPISSLKKIKTGKFVSAISEMNQEEREQTEDWTINPEYKQLLVNGYKPKDDREYRELLSLINKGEIENFKDNPFIGFFLQNNPEYQKYLRVGTPESDYTKNILDEFLINPIPRENVSVRITEQAGIMKESFKSINGTFIQHPYGLEVKLNGLLNTNFDLDVLEEAARPQAPNWNINYIENNAAKNYILTVNKNNFYSDPSKNTPSNSFVKIVGALDAASNDSSQDPSNPDENNSSNSGLNQSALDRLNELSVNQEQCNPENNEELAAAIFLDNIGNIFEPAIDGFLLEEGQFLEGQERNFLNETLKNKFNNIFTSFMKNAFDGLLNNRLLKNFDPTAGLNLNSFDEDPSSRNTLTVLGMLNFLPETPDYLLECNKKLHPLNMDEILKLMTDKYNESASSREIVDSVEKSPPDPIGQTISMGTTLLFIRLMTFEYLLKNIVVFDQFEYDKSLTQSPILKEYISIEIKKQLEDLNIYRRIERSINNNYDFLKSKNIIKNEDETTTNLTLNSIVDDKAFIAPSPRFKNLVSAMLRKNVGYIKNLIGFDSTAEENSTGRAINKLLSASKVYDIFSSKNRNLTNKNVKFINCDIRRFANKYKKNENDEENSFFIFERFIKFNGFKRNIFSTEQNFNTANDILKTAGVRNGELTSFQEFSCFINDFLLTHFFINSTISSISSLIKTTELQRYNNLINLCISTIKNSNRLTDAERNRINSDLDYFFEPFEIGVRMSLILKNGQKILFENNVYTTLDEQEKQRFINFHAKKDFIINSNNSKNVLINRAIKDRAHSFIDENPEEYIDDTQKTALRYYNSITIDQFQRTCSFSEINLFKNINYFKYSHKKNTEINNILEWSRQANILDPSDIVNFDSSVNLMFKNLEDYFKNIKNSLFEGLNSKANYQLITRKSMPSDKIINLISFYSDCSLVNKQMITLFRRTKTNIKRLLLSAENIESYEFLPPTTDEEYTRDMNDVGNPNPQSNLDLLWFILTTPILIFKGLTQILDPNIAIASQVVNAAAAGLLFPKFENGRPVYPGDPLLLPTVLVSLALLPTNIFLPFIPPLAIGPPVTPLGMIYWALEPLLWKFPYFKKLASESSAAQALSTNPEYGNIKISSISEPYFICDRNQDENP